MEETEVVIPGGTVELTILALILLIIPWVWYP